MKMLQQAQAKGLYEKVIKLDISALPWSDLPADSFDVVACNGVLIYVDEVSYLPKPLGTIHRLAIFCAVVLSAKTIPFLAPNPVPVFWRKVCRTQMLQLERGRGKGLLNLE